MCVCVLEKGDVGERGGVGVGRQEEGRGEVDRGTAGEYLFKIVFAFFFMSSEHCIRRREGGGREKGKSKKRRIRVVIEKWITMRKRG